jgi:hypothetical protein
MLQGNYAYCNGFAESIAKQRLDKHPATEYAIGRMLKLVAREQLCKHGQASTIQRDCFLWCPRRAKVWRYRKYVARQRSGKHAFATIGDGVFRGVRAKELS